jgi:hypothetical protein
MDGPMPFRQRVKVRLDTECSLPGRRLEDLNALYTVVRYVFQDSWWFVANRYFVFFPSSAPRVLRQSLQNFEATLLIFSLLIFGPYTFNYYFFILE